MKKILSIFLLLILIQHVYAQKAEPIPTYASESKPMPWYKQQLIAWQQLVDKNPSDEKAWYNVFKITRILTYHDTTDKRIGEARETEMKQVVEKMSKSIPNSYEYYFCKWQLHGNDMAYYSDLEKAISINPSRPEHLDYMINISEMNRNIIQRDEYSLKKINANEMSVGLMYYNYNTIIGLEKNAILLTAGDNDTYPVWALQAKGIRKDVYVLNLYLLKIKSYREKIFDELGIPQIEVNEEDENDIFNAQLIQHLAKNKKNCPVYASLTTVGCQHLLDNVQSDLYLTGLAYIYNTSSFDNMAILKKNIEKLYALDYLDKDFYFEISKSRIKEVNRNYIVPMLKLYSHYAEADDIQKKQWIKEKLILISKDTEDEQTVLNYVN